MFARLSLFLVSLLSLSLTHAESVSAETLVFLGDSLTAGYNLSQEQAFPAFIDKRIKNEGFRTSWTVVNAGVSGDTSAGGRTRLRWILRSQPDVVFVCLGANDGLRGIKPAETEKNLRTIITELQERKVKVLLAGIQLPTNYGPAHTAEFTAIFPRVAKDLNVPLVPFLLEGVATDDKLLLPDRLHPNEAGAKRIADVVWPHLRPLLVQFDKPKN